MYQLRRKCRLLAMKVTRTARQASDEVRLAGQLLLLLLAICGLLYLSSGGGGQHNTSIVIENRLRIEAHGDSGEEEGAVRQKPVIVRAGPGELGRPVVLNSSHDPEIQGRIEAGFKTHAFNEYVSDLISFDRSLPDFRHESCLTPGLHLPHSQLPSTSIIITFHNEAWSTLIRTIHSIFNRSPPELVEEIILVDDASELEHLGSQLEGYISRFSKVKLLRSQERIGLTRARLLGVHEATAPVITFLDSHCECSAGWLEPLLDRIAKNPSSVVSPIVDIIVDDTFEYENVSTERVGGFNWNLLFTWRTLPRTDGPSSPIASQSSPIPSPTIPGGLLAVNKEFFRHIGEYDPGFDIWGGENLELSFKTWMCGGRLEFIPCSRVGHVFRKRSPYIWRPGVDVLKKNAIRLAEVWLDDYKKFLYSRMSYRHSLIDYGDVSSRHKLRQQLGCRDFSWYHRTIYPDLWIPDPLAMGEIRSLSTKVFQKCLDSCGSKECVGKPIDLYPCHKQGGNQFWVLTKTGEIRRDGFCVEDFNMEDVLLRQCTHNKGGQEWIWQQDLPPSNKGAMLRHPHSGKCLTLRKDKKALKVESCDEADRRQRWQLETFTDWEEDRQRAEKILN